jgi:hypothetical protein
MSGGTQLSVLIHFTTSNTLLKRFIAETKAVYVYGLITGVQFAKLLGVVIKMYLVCTQLVE